LLIILAWGFLPLCILFFAITCWHRHRLDKMGKIWVDPIDQKETLFKNMFPPMWKGSTGSTWVTHGNQSQMLISFWVPGNLNATHHFLSCKSM
jgi:hypothetical protein